MPSHYRHQPAFWPSRVLSTIVGIWLLCALNPAVIAQEDTATPQEAAPVAAPSAPAARQAPDIDAKKRALLREQYPQEDLRNLTSASGETFTALWRKDQTGDAFGAVLIVPDSGQTANWPNTIDVLRLDLPSHGWSTLSIDLVEQRQPVISKNSTPAPDGTSVQDKNRARMQGAIQFLNSEGQYNIIVVGYGESAVRVIDFVGTLAPASPGMPGKSKLNRPVRALVLINARNTIGNLKDPAFDKLVWRDVPVLDVFFGTHFRDPFEIDNRKIAAQKNRLTTYYQLKLLEPTTTVFSGENRLSRRIRGFLNNNAKGVEIERNSAR